MTDLRRLVAALLCVGGAACSNDVARSADGRADTVHVEAVLLSPVDVSLTWRDPVPGAVAHAVEWRADAKDEWVVLETLPADVETFAHARLMPNVTHQYRVRAVYGQASPALDVVLPPGLSDAEYTSRVAAHEDFTWARPVSLPVSAHATAPLRIASAASLAAPTDFAAVRVASTVSGFQLTWTDRASDEDGYLLEMRPDGAAEFTVAAMTDPDVHAFGYALTPPVRRAAVRIRAFYYGPPSNVATTTTGPAPEWSDSGDDDR
jgi:hypothetical protein